jgi:hypothetical protein
MQPIYTQTVGAGGAGALTFNNIPQGFTDLKIVISARSSLTNYDNLMLRFNGDTTVPNYSTTSVYGDGSIFASERVLNFYNLSYAAGSLPNSSSAASTFGNLEAYIPNYSSGNLKQIITSNAAENNVASVYVRNNFGAGLYKSTSPITSITIFAFGNLAEHTTVTIYGISQKYAGQAGTAPTIGAVTDQAEFASVAFTPASNDQAQLYRVTNTTNSAVTFGQSSPIIAPATLNTATTYTVAAVNDKGSGTSSASSSITTANSYASISTVRFTDSSTSGAFFNNIPQNYKHLQLRCLVRMASSQSTPYDLTVTVNSNNTSGDYSYHLMRGDGASTSLAGLASDSVLRFPTSVPNGSMNSNVFGVLVIDLINYTDTNKNKVARAIWGYDNNTASTPTAGWVGQTSSAYYQQAPISSLTVASFGNFAQFSHCALYGIS